MPDIKITVILTEHKVPFDQMVTDVATFATDAEALDYINAASQKWWIENDGDRCIAEVHAAELGGEEITEYTPIEELGYDTPMYMLWDGESLFHAMLDANSYWRLHEAHYKREYDDKGEKRPGYLRVAMGEDVTDELKELYDFYGKRQ